jgi:hypothetical protein
LSVTLFSSRATTSATWRSASRTAPWTCGTQRTEYWSCTLAQSRWLAPISLSASRRRTFSAGLGVPAVRAERGDARVEGRRAAELAFERQRARDVGGRAEVQRPGEREPADGAGERRAVDEREALFRFEADRREARADGAPRRRAGVRRRNRLRRRR